MEIFVNEFKKVELKGAILDWAGTTIDFGSIAPAKVFVEIFREKGIELAIEEAREPMGLHKKDHIRKLVRKENIAQQWRKIYGSDCSEIEINEMFNLFAPKQLKTIENYTELLPTTIEGQKILRERGIKIATTTGYNYDVLHKVITEAKSQGFDPDSNVCSSEVNAGRPAPWMAFKTAMILNIFPMSSFIKIGDTLLDMKEGFNAGCWTIGIVDSSNEMGLSLDDFNKLSKTEIERNRNYISKKFRDAGAHFTINDYSELSDVLDEIEKLTAAGERP